MNRDELAKIDTLIKEYDALKTLLSNKSCDRGVFVVSNYCHKTDHEWHNVHIRRERAEPLIRTLMGSIKQELKDLGFTGL